MAKCKIKNGREYWYPDDYTAKRHELLDPNLSPNENIWNTIYKVTCVWLSKARVYATDEQSMAALEQDVRLATYLRLRYVVVTKQYRKEYNFWTNVTRCCWAVCNKCIQAWFEDKYKLDRELCGDDLVNGSDGDSYFDMHSRRPQWITGSDAPYKKKKHYTEYRRPYDRWKALCSMVDDDYMKYCEICDEVEVEPVDKETFIADNYTDEQRQFMKNPPEECTQGNSYFRNYIAKKKALDPEWYRRHVQRQHEYYLRRKAKRHASACGGSQNGQEHG